MGITFGYTTTATPYHRPCRACAFLLAFPAAPRATDAARGPPPNTLLPLPPRTPRTGLLGPFPRGCEHRQEHRGGPLDRGDEGVMGCQKNVRVISPTIALQKYPPAIIPAIALRINEIVLRINEVHGTKTTCPLRINAVRCALKRNFPCASTTLQSYSGTFFRQ